MIRIYPLLLLILVSFTDHVGSVVLTSSPLTASDGKLFTLICSSNTTSGQDRQWYRDDVPVFTTTQGSSSPSISNQYVFQYYLTGRVNVSCEVLQHNVTLRIISDTDSGTRWKCLDNSKSQASRTVTIHVTELQSKPAATLILSTPVITTTTEDKSLTKSTGSNSQQLTSSPGTALPDQPYTLVCSSSGSAGRSRDWYWMNDIVFRTRYVSDTQCPVTVANNYNYRDLSGRINVTCSYNQYNVTLRILTSIDNGSVWWCADSLSRQESNRLTIDVVNLMTASSTATTAATTTTTVFPLCKDGPNVVYIAVGAAMGGIVVGCVITIIVVIVWMRRRNTSTEDDARAPNIYTSPSHYEDMGHQYGKVERQYVNTVEGIGSGSPDSVNTEDQVGNAAYYNTAGQHQHRDEDADTGNTTYYNTARDADN